jgi:glycosyltransferase involved in cell wall biosynthesis
MVKRRDKKIVIVMPAYNAAKTLKQTYEEIPEGSYDEIILVDDASKDDTIRHAKNLDIIVKAHPKNKGYGGNQKTCYTEALKRGADIVIMLHPDNQYDPGIVPNIALPILEGQADVVLASRFIRDPLEGGPIKGGMPVYKFFGNRFLTFIENLVLKTYFSEFHTGYRAFSRKALESVNFMENSDNFVFDNEIIVQLILKKMRFKEIGVRTRYFKEASSVDFFTSSRYGLAILKTLVKYWLHVKNIKKFAQFE